MSFIDRIYVQGFIKELQEWADDHSKKMFRAKVLRVYLKCARAGKIKLAVRIAEKYRKELTEPLRSDLPMAMNYALFVNNITKPKQ